MEEIDPDEVVKQKLSTVSFGSLAKAQEALHGNVDRRRKRKRGSDAKGESESKLEVLRARLRELKERKANRGVEAAAGSKKELGAKSSEAKTTAGKRARHNDEASEDSDNSQEGGFFDNKPAEVDAEEDSEAESEASSEGNKKRSSKHAPTAMPANRAVSWHRKVVPIAADKSRDPRFDPLTGRLDEVAIAHRYSFLNDYQASEVTDLRKALKDKKSKLTDHERETLERKMISLNSKISANKAKERTDKVVREHRKKEKEMVAQGKQPFHLKQSEVRKQALVDRFEGMKSREKDKVLQRRRKKLMSKERRNMPDDRRV